MITKVNEQEFRTKVMNDGIAVVDFSATWCGPCRMLAPVLEQISEELAGKVNFYNVDVDDDTPLAAKYGIQNIPSLMLLKNGEAVDMKVGFMPEPVLAKWLEEKI